MLRVGRVVGWVGGREADRWVDDALLLLLIDPVPFGGWQIEKVLHGFQISQQRLRGGARVLLFAEDLRQQALEKTMQIVSVSPAVPAGI